MMDGFPTTAETSEAKAAVRKYIAARRDADIAAHEHANTIFEQACRHTDMIEACLLSPDEYDEDDVDWRAARGVLQTQKPAEELVRDARGG